MVDISHGAQGAGGPFLFLTSAIEESFPANVSGRTEPMVFQPLALNVLIS